MTENPDVRWKQRFQHFKQALELLQQGLQAGPSRLSLLEKEGIIQRFEYTFELAWKTVKDYLEAEGVIITPVTPRQILKDAFAAKVIADGQVWIEMLDHRNLLSHTYDCVVFEEAVDAIARRYISAIIELERFFLSKSCE